MYQQFYFWMHTQKNWKKLCIYQQYWYIYKIQKYWHIYIHFPPKGGSSPNVQNTWVDKHNVVCTYTGMLFNLKEDRNSNTHWNMGEWWGHYARWMYHNMTNSVDSSYKWYCNSQSLERERRMIIARCYRYRKMGSYCSMSTNFPFSRWKEI